MKRTVCFGELMGRLNPEGYLRMVQAQRLELSYAGGEANVGFAFVPGTSGSVCDEVAQE